MSEKKNADLGGMLNVLDLDRVFDNSVFILKDFSIRENDKAEKISGHLKIGIAGVSLKNALIDLGSALVISWAQKVRSNGAWNMTPPKEGELVEFQALEFFVKKEKSAKETDMELIARLGINEAIKIRTAYMLELAARQAGKKEGVAIHATPEEIQKRNEEEKMAKGEKV